MQFIISLTFCIHSQWVAWMGWTAEGGGGGAKLQKEAE